MCSRASRGSAGMSDTRDEGKSRKCTNERLSRVWWLGNSYMHVNKCERVRAARISSFPCSVESVWALYECVFFFA